MLDPELTSAEASPPLVPRETVEALAIEERELFRLLAVVRAASAASLHTLYFSQPPRGVRSLREAQRRLSVLVDSGLVIKQRVACARALYHLGSAAITLVPEVAARVTDHFRKPLPEEEAGYAWLRTTMWSVLRKRGFAVGRGQPELVALRRSLVDAQSERAGEGDRVLQALRADRALAPLFRSRCASCGSLGPLNVALRSCARCRADVSPLLSERKVQCSACDFVGDGTLVAGDKGHSARCAGTLRDADHLAFDVAWRRNGAAREVLILFVDDPRLSLEAQLRALPLRILGQPRIDVILRTTDPTSVYDRRKRAWSHLGDRHRALLRAFSEGGAKDTFPFSKTANVIEVAPEIQLRLAQPRRRKDRSHA